MKGNAIGDVLIVCMHPGRAITNENDELLSIEEHNHEGNEVEVEVAKVYSMCSEGKGKNQNNSPIPRLFRTASQDEEVSATLPTFTSIQTTLYRGR